MYTFLSLTKSQCLIVSLSQSLSFLVSQSLSLFVSHILYPSESQSHNHSAIEYGSKFSFYLPSYITSKDIFVMRLVL